MSTPPAQPEPAAPEPGSEPESPRRVLLEVGLVFGGATLACAVLWQLQGFVPLVRSMLQGLIAAIFLFVPTEVMIRRNLSFQQHGLTARPLGRGLALFAAASLAVFPLFAVGFYGYYRLLCGPLGQGLPLPGQIRRFCARFVPNLAAARLTLPPDFGQVALNQLLGVALPEEYFFRGYLQTRLEAVWPSRRRLLGAPVGLALPLASLLFALGHVLVDFNPLRMAVFFPALVFGWMRQASGSILAGVLFHAASNLVIDVLQRSFIRL